MTINGRSINTKKQPVICPLEGSLYQYTLAKTLSDPAYRTSFDIGSILYLYCPNTRGKQLTSFTMWESRGVTTQFL